MVYFKLKQDFGVEHNMGRDYRLWIRKQINIWISNITEKMFYVNVVHCTAFLSHFLLFSPVSHVCFAPPLPVYCLFTLLYHAFTLLLLTSLPSSLVSRGAGFS